MKRNRSGEYEVKEIRQWVLNTESIYRIEQELAHVYAKQVKENLFNEDRAINDIINNIVIPTIDLIKSHGNSMYTNERIRRDAAYKVLELIKEEIDYILEQES